MRIKRSAVLMLVVGLTCSFARGQSDTPAPATANADTFARDVDLTAFGTIAVHTQGRVKSFESFAMGMMQFVMGSRRIDGQSPSFTYLDLMLRPERYADRDVIFVKMKLIRVQIAQALAAAGAGQVIENFDDRMQRFIKTGLIAEDLLLSEPVQSLMNRLRTDLVRTATKVEQIDTAIQVKNPNVLRQNLTSALGMR